MLRHIRARQNTSGTSQTVTLCNEAAQGLYEIYNVVAALFDTSNVVEGRAPYRIYYRSEYSTD